MVMDIQCCCARKFYTHCHAIAKALEDHAALPNSCQEHRDPRFKRYGNVYGHSYQSRAYLPAKYPPVTSTTINANDSEQAVSSFLVTCISTHVSKEC